MRILLALMALLILLGVGPRYLGAEDKAAEARVEEAVTETDIANASIFARAWQGGFLVFLVLLVLVACSIFAWALMVVKFIYLNKTAKVSEAFAKSFWDSRSLNELNSRLSDYPDSPVKEVFRTGYAELVRGSQLRDQSGATPVVIHAAVGNLGRALTKARNAERRKMETYLPILAIIASASPFVGLFGTVWGIMGAFEGIARSGSASLAAVAPGISEALIATAFGLAAAIPAVIGYNLAAAKIRGQLSFIDGFSSDFMNIVERYLVTDRQKGAAPGNPL
jgi:biopolymer transport protein TolQ